MEHEDLFKDNIVKVVKHFKRENADVNSLDYIYLYLGVAVHSETKEKLVIYQSASDSNKIWARPYEMFVSEVDHEKYPDIKQKYRFEEINHSEREHLRKIAWKEFGDSHNGEVLINALNLI